MRLDSLHPGATVEQVRETIGWDVRVAADLRHARADRRGAPAHPRRARSRGHLHEAERTRRSVTTGPRGTRYLRARPRGRRLADTLRAWLFLPARGRPDPSADVAPDRDPLPRRHERREPAARPRRGPATAVPGRAPGRPDRAAAGRAVDRARPDRGPDRRSCGSDCYLAMRVAEAIGLRRRELARPLLRGHAQGRRLLEQCRGGHPDLRRRRHRAQGPPGDRRARRSSNTPRSRSGTCPTTEPLPLRLRRLIRDRPHGHARAAQVEQLRCERGAAIARKAGFSDARRRRRSTTCTSTGTASGQPRGLRGDRDQPAGPDPGRLPGPRHLPCDPRPGRRGPGPARAARDVVRPGHRRRAARPALAGLLDELAAPDLVGRTMALEPAGCARISDDDDIDRIASAFADIVDAKSPFTGSHSRGVAGYAEGARRPAWACRPRGSPTSAGRACSTTSASSASRT